MLSTILKRLAARIVGDLSADTTPCACGHERHEHCGCGCVCMKHDDEGALLCKCVGFRDAGIKLGS